MPPPRRRPAPKKERLNQNLEGLVSLIVLLCVSVAPALGIETIPFQRLSLDDGLSQATIYSILQDRRGYMWFGTLEGLNRFDGNRFQVYTHDAGDPTSLSHDAVRSILEDREGVLWVGTDGGGLNRFDEATGRFARWRHDPEDATSLGSDRIRVLFEDSAGTLWVGTDGGGLNRFDRDSGTFEVFVHQPDQAHSLAANNVRAVYEQPLGQLWIGTEGGGLDRFDPETGDFVHHRHNAADPRTLSSNRVRTILGDHNGDLWVGTNDGGLNRLDRTTRTFSRFRHVSGDPTTLGSDRVRDLLQDTEGRLWVATDAGLSRFVAGSESFLSYRHHPTDSTSLSDDRVTRLYLDRGGVLWVGTFGGLNKWNSLAGTFDHFRAEPNDSSGLSHSNVMALHEGADGEIWVGTWGGGLNRLDRRRNEVRRYRHNPGDATSLSADRVMAILEDSRGIVWAGTVGGGLNRLDPGRSGFRRYLNDPSDPASLSANDVTSIIEDPRGSLWIGTYRGGLNRLDLETDRFTHYRHDPNDSTTLSSDRVVAVHRDRSGVLWIGTDGAGLNRLDPASGAISNFRNEPADPASLSSDNVWSILEDDKGDLWVGTQTGGFNRWRAEDRYRSQPVFERYTREDGLESNLVYGILADGAGNLWLSSNRGLSRFNPETESFRHYDRSHGLQEREFNGGAYHRSRSGEMFFGGPNGFNAFFPGQLRGNSHVPPVEVTGLLKFNKPFDLGSPVWATDRVELGFRDSVIAFEFAALDFTEPKKNRYLHKLEGFDRDWIESNEIHRATYTNLDAGRYTFRVIASNNEGVWNEQGASLEVLVAPPPWASWWAYGLYGFVVLGGLVTFSRAQAKKRERAAELEKTNESLERQIRERRRAERALSKLSSAVEQSPASVVITDPEGCIEYVNPKFQEITGYSLDEVKGRKPTIFESGYTDRDQHAEIWRSVREGKEWRGELHSRKKNGDLYWEYASVSPIRSRDGRITHILAANEDITVRKAYEEKLLRQEHFDALTELPNRTLAFDRLSRAVVQRRHQKDVVAVICVDLDNFKIVNDTLGHATGDQLLIESGKRLVATVGAAPTVARLGGDEFLVILPNLPSVVEGEMAAAKIRDAFKRPFILDGRDIFISASLGITASPADGEDPNVLLRNADAAMHMAKKHGRGAYRFFTPAMNAQVTRRLDLESGLRRALAEGDQLGVAYQPLVDASSGQVVGVEALLRWESPELGVVHPEEAIAVAEETGAIVEIGRWVLETACREIRKWSEETGFPLRVAVNVSSRQFTSCDLVQVTSRVLSDTGLPPECLELELTESLLLEDSTDILATLRSLSDLGVRLSLDDFGTGYSALSYLKKYPFDSLKIDRSFVSGIREEGDETALIKAILAMGHSLSLEVIAEGVETDSQFRFLRSIGCDLVQGYYFCRPVTADVLLELLRECAGTMGPADSLESYPASA